MSNGDSCQIDADVDMKESANSDSLKMGSTVDGGTVSMTGGTAAAARHIGWLANKLRFSNVSRASFFRPRARGVAKGGATTCRGELDGRYEHDDIGKDAFRRTGRWSESRAGKTVESGQSEQPAKKAALPRK